MKYFVTRYLRCNLRGSSLVKHNINKGEEEETETGDSSLESEMEKVKTTLLGKRPTFGGHWSILARIGTTILTDFLSGGDLATAVGDTCLRMILSGDKSRRRIRNGRRRKNSVVKNS